MPISRSEFISIVKPGTSLDDAALGFLRQHDETGFTSRELWDALVAPYALSTDFIYASWREVLRRLAVHESVRAAMRMGIVYYIWAGEPGNSGYIRPEQLYASKEDYEASYEATQRRKKG